MARKDSPSPTDPPNSSVNEELHSSILAFIKKLGYRQTEQIFRDEARHAGIETIAFELRAEQDSSLQPAILLDKVATSDNESASLSLSGNKRLGEVISGVSGISGISGVSAGELEKEREKVTESAYEQMFSKLKKWSFDSLDIYRDELSQVLYPMFIHCFLDLIAKNLCGNAHKFFEKFRDEFKLLHGDELARLKSINDSFQMKDNTLASTYRNNKYNLTMSAYSFQLLVNFLQENNYFILLKILNQYINIRVLVSRPSVTASTGSGPLSAASNRAALDKETRPQGIVGLSPTLQNQINMEPLSWGVHLIDPMNESEILRRLRNDLALNGSLKTQEQLNNAVNQIKKNLIGSTESAPKHNVLPRPQAGAAELSLAVERIKGIASRAMLSTTNLPSVCCYTIHNAYDCICSADFSADFSLMAVGNRESYIDIWSLTKQRLRALRPSTELSAMSTTDLESIDCVSEASGTWSKRLVGHSGPVFACRFSPDNQFLFSCSQDGSVRMWSLCTFSSLVVYKGHNGPVWDVDVGPSGHYFVSGSADRTARLWSTQGLQPLRLFVGHLSDVDVVKFHPNSNYVLTGSSDKSIRMWDIHKGNCVRLFTGHTRGVTCLTISSNGRLLASGDSSGVVKIWDIAEGKLFKSLIFESNSNINTKITTIYALSFCQDGKILVSCASDNTLRIWDVQKLTTTPNSTSTLEEPLAVFHTKQTPLITAKFTGRNVLSVIGAFNTE